MQLQRVVQQQVTAQATYNPLNKMMGLGKQSSSHSLK
jgi:hypothetical protein